MRAVVYQLSLQLAAVQNFISNHYTDLFLFLDSPVCKSKDLTDRTQLYQAFQENTHIVAHYFDLRTQSYFKQVMGPVFGVDTCWYRQEFAKRVV